MTETIDFGNKKDTLVEQLAFAKAIGYKEEFQPKDPDHLHIVEGDKTFTPEQIVIVHHYRFEGDSNPPPLYPFSLGSDQWA